MDDFDTPPINLQTNQHAFLVDVDGYEGPLSVLLNLARTQKVDLRKISVLKLAEQYLAFIEKSKALRLELAADYLVMAAWLAFLKSRLLLPVDPTDDAPSGAELAARLAFQLERLEAMRKSAARLMGRDQMGRDFFARGTQESVSENLIITYRAGVLDLMQAYARLRTAMISCRCTRGRAAFYSRWSKPTRGCAGFWERRLNGRGWSNFARWLA